MAELEVRVLQPGDDRSGFVSGDPDLDRFFQKYAGQNQFRYHVGTTYVAVSDGTRRKVPSTEFGQYRQSDFARSAQITHIWKKAFLLCRFATAGD
jgi:hypothetical protein